MQLVGLISTGVLAWILTTVHGAVLSQMPEAPTVPAVAQNLRRSSAVAATDAASATATTLALANALKSLWAGTDFRNSSFSFQFLKPVKSGVAAGAKKVQVFGLQHTGTNLLNALLYINFGRQINYVEPPTEPLAAEEEDAVAGRSGLWRHANIKENWGHERSFVETIGGSNVSAIVMIREPFAWLHQVKENPLEFETCASNDENWLSKPCKHSSPGGIGSIPEKPYPNMAAIYNQWYDGYTNAATFGYPRSRIFKYEDLVGNPDAVLDGIAKFLDLEKPATGWRGLSETTDGQNSGRVKAFEEIHTKPFMDEFSGQQKRQICSLVDKKISETYGYARDCGKIMSEHGF